MLPTSPEVCLQGAVVGTEGLTERPASSGTDPNDVDFDAAQGRGLCSKPRRYSILAKGHSNGEENKSGDIRIIGDRGWELLSMVSLGAEWCASVRARSFLAENSS
jgi:hypothetical protein